MFNVQTVHQNAEKSAVELTESGSPITEGERVLATTEHEGAVLVVDSPPYGEGKCTAIRKDGEPCRNVLTKAYQLERGVCLGHFKVGSADGEK